MHTLRIHCTGRPGAELKSVVGTCPAAAWDADDLTISVWLGDGTQTAGVPDAFDITTIETLRLEARADATTEEMYFDAKEISSFTECTYIEFKDAEGEHGAFVLTGTEMNLGDTVDSIWISITAELSDGTRHTFAAGTLSISHSGDSTALGPVADPVTPYARYGFKNVAVSGQTTVTADTREDTLTLVAGSGVTLTTSGNSITIAASSGSGDVVGPSSAVNSRLAAFDGTTGKLIKDSTFTISGTSGSTLNIGTGGTLGTAAFTASTAYAAASHAHAWGSITGTLSDQTDLQTALNGKLDDTEVTLNGTFDMIPRLDSSGNLLLASGGFITGNAGNTNGKVTLYSVLGGATEIIGSNSTITRTWDHPDTDGIYASQNYVDTFTGSSNIASLGTITSGVWNGTTIAVANGGTGATDAATARTNLGLGNVDNTSNATERAATATLTNKRITPRIGTTTSSATPSINTDTVDQYNITALAAAITSMTTNLSGTPTDGQKLLIRIKDNGTARAITWGASFQSITATLPTTTTANKLTYVGLVYNSAASKWDCLATGTEA